MNDDKITVLLNKDGDYVATMDGNVSPGDIEPGTFTMSVTPEQLHLLQAGAIKMQPDGQMSELTDFQMRQNFFKRLLTLGEDHQCITIVMFPNKDVGMRHDHLPLYTVLGVLRTMVLKIEHQLQYHDHPDDDEEEGDGFPSDVTVYKM